MACDGGSKLCGLGSCTYATSPPLLSDLLPMKTGLNRYEPQSAQWQIGQIPMHRELAGLGLFPLPSIPNHRSAKLHQNPSRELV